MNRNAIVPIICLVMLGIYILNVSDMLRVGAEQGKDQEFEFRQGEETMYGSTSQTYNSNCSVETHKPLVRGGELINQGMLDEAESVFKKILSREPLCFSALVSLGATYSYKQDFWKADELYRKALEVKPDSALVYKSMGVLYSKAKGNKASLPYLMKAVEIDPNMALAHWALGVNYYVLGNFRLSRDHLVKFIELAPSSIHVERANEFIENIDRS